MSEPEIDFLSDEAPDEVVETEVVEAAPPEVETVETPEPPAPEVPTTPEPKEEHVPLAALKAEREKRQKYERELAEYRQREQQQEQQLPDFHQSPDGYIQAVLSQHSQQLQARMLGALEEQVRTQYPDYDEVFEVLREQAEQNPALTTQVMQAPNPALAAYRLGKQLRELSAMQDPEAYRKQIESEVRAQIKAEADAAEAARRKAADAIPPNLADARASKDDEVLPDDSLESILKSKR